MQTSIRVSAQRATMQFLRYFDPIPRVIVFEINRFDLSFISSDLYEYSDNRKVNIIIFDLFKELLSYQKLIEQNEM